MDPDLGRMADVIPRVIQLGQIRIHHRGASWRTIPPIILFRPRSLDPAVGGDLSMWVETYRGAVPWRLERPEPGVKGNWMIAPCHLWEVAAVQGFASITPSVRWVYENEPEFAPLANDDLDPLAEHILASWKESVDRAGST